MLGTFQEVIDLRLMIDIFQIQKSNGGRVSSEFPPSLKEAGKGYFLCS